MLNGRGRRIRVLLLGVMLFCALFAGTALASAVHITGCKLAGERRLEVTATADVSEITGDYCYLFALPFSGGSVSENAKPVVKVRKSASMVFSKTLTKSKVQTYLDYRFVVAQKSGNTYKVISNYRYINNPGQTATYRYSFPTASSKKGLQVAGSMLPDATELNVQHAAINIVFTEMLAGSWEKNKSSSYSFSYKGKRYWFRKSAIAGYDRQLVAMKETGAVCSAILLLGYRSDYSYLIPAAGRKGGHNFYAWNVNNQKARETLEACLTFLSKRYASSSAPHGRIVNWIVGNEVADYRAWNYGGELSLSQYANLYAGAFRMTYNAVASVYANARVYISLDHRWNCSVNNSFTGRAMLDAFASALNAHGSIPWNLAYHPYASPLHETKFWENKDQMLKESLTSPIINMGNLSILTNYIRTKYGPNTRIILSEQGFTSVRNKKKEENVQSAAIAYSYLLTEADDMVDSFIMNRHVDHIAETSAGLYLGLWTNSSMEWAKKKKESWTTFKYMDTNLSETVTKAALKVIGAKSWKDLIPTYSEKTYNKTSIFQGKLSVVSGYGKRSVLAKKWKKYGAASSIKIKKGVITVKHNGSSNPNLQWGITQNFSKGLNLKKGGLYTTVKLKGASKGKARIRIRMYSGKNRYECACTVTSGKSVRLGTLLGDWEYANKITRIQILAEPISGGWSGSANLVLTLPVYG